MQPTLLVADAYGLLWTTAKVISVDYCENTHSYEAQNLLECTVVFLIECRPTFQRYVLTPSSGR
jgi:hypothetical protein